MRKIVLVIAAHPDDEVLGCGGTLSRLSKEGNQVFTLVLGEGITSRSKNNKSENEKELNKLKNEAIKANKILGIEKIFFGDFPDNRFDQIPMLDIVKKIEEIKSLINPSVVYTHHRGDLNIDHRITFLATLTSFRPVEEEKVNEIYSFEILSSTEWNYPNSFNPNVYVHISDITEKINSMKLYSSEIRLWPHPRSPEAIENLARRRGSEVGLEYAEAFELIRKIENK